MDRLPLELDRLYGLGPGAAAAGSRVAVLAVRRPAGWNDLSPAWRGVQSELDLPAPAIAVSGADGLQLWFAFASPITAAAGNRFLQGVRERYLPALKAAQVRLSCGADACPAAPPVEVSPEHWSAFITNDLAAVFEETPWLDIAPSDDGQAALLRALDPIRPVVFEAACQKLGLGDPGGPLSSDGTSPAEPRPADPARFLAGVMHDETAPLALRIEAAAVLLRHARPA